MKRKTWVSAFRKKYGRNPTAEDLEQELRKWGIEPRIDANGNHYYDREQFEGAWATVLDKKPTN